MTATATCKSARDFRLTGGSGARNATRSDIKCAGEGRKITEAHLACAGCCSAACGGATVGMTTDPNIEEEADLGTRGTEGDSHRTIKAAGSERRVSNSRVGGASKCVGCNTFLGQISCRRPGKHMHALVLAENRRVGRNKALPADLAIRPALPRDDARRTT